MARPFRFGLVFTSGRTAAQLAALAKRTEDDGFSSLLVADHLANDMACGPVIMAVAAATSVLRVGSYVYNNDFRHPAVLAKEAATIDVLSGGRLELGIGAGYNRAEYDAAGIPFESARVRIDRMEETLAILEQAFAGGPMSYTGRHYQINGLEGTPRPVQRHIPIMIGGGGPRMLRLAAQRADIVALVPQSRPEGGLDASTVTGEAFDARVAVLDASLAQLGRTRDEGPERSVLVFDVWASADADTRRGYVPAEHLASSPYALAGTVGALEERLHAMRERWGISYFVAFAEETNVDHFRALVRQMTR